MAPIKLLASPAHSVNSYKNLRTKVMKFCANIYFNPFKDEAQTALFKDPIRTAL